MRHASLAFLLLVTTSAQAATPNLRTFRPPGGQRGTELEVILSGSRLGDAREVLFYQPGIETVRLEKVDDDNVKATLKIAPDCALGRHDIRLRTATGISELKTFSVGALPELAETEPNNKPEAPQSIAMGVVINGLADADDVDFYAIEARKGDRITAEVEGIRLGITLFDPYIAIRDAKGAELASSDDAPLVRQDGVCSIVAPEDGTYLVEVRESAYAGDRRCVYRLHVGDFPRPTAIVPAGGPAGETVEVRWIGGVEGERTTREVLPAEVRRDFGLLATDDRGTAPDSNPFRISPFGNAMESEPNDDHATATPFVPPRAINGILATPGDVDHFAFEAKKGQVLDVRVFARSLRSPLDSVLTVFKKGGGTVASNDDSGGPDSYLRFTAPDDGSYVVAIRDHLKAGGPDRFYRIELAPVEPRLTISLPSESPRRGRGTGAVVAAIPRGNRQSLLVNAKREDFGGALEVRAEGLPDGITFEYDPTSAELGTFPVLFHADPGAPEAGALAAIEARPVDSKVEVASRFAHTIELVLGQNNVPFWTRTVDRFAVAVTDEAPFSIEVVEPKVPLVRNGSMQLKVIAHRQEGFKAPIALKVPWLPPGVGASGNVAIAEGQTEALIPMNANGNAGLKTWKIVVDGTGVTAGGPLTVSTPMAALTIAEPFVQFAFEAAAVEQGKAAALSIKVAKLKDFEGEATVKLVGLPSKATAETRTITRDTTDLVIPIQTAPETPAGNNKNLLCQVVVTQQGEPILHNLGTGSLRVDTPIPPKAGDPVASDPEPGSKPEKPLSRLEQLRLEAAARAKAAAEGGRR